MIDINKEQFIYLLQSFICSEGYRVSIESVKFNLPHQKAGVIYSSLKGLGLVQEIDSESFYITEKGFYSVVLAMTSNNSHYGVSKSGVINNLISALKEANTSKQKGMSLEEFEVEFKSLYLNKRRKQELRGVVCIRSKEILYDFMIQNPSITQEKLEEYFNWLKSSGKIFAVIENGVEVFQWCE